MAQSQPMIDVDKQLLIRIGRGDECALAKLYEKYAAMVFSFVVTRTPDRMLAEEIAADVWLGCWRSAPAFRGDSRVLTWLLGIAKRQIYVHTRRKFLPQISLDESEYEIAAEENDLADLVVSGAQAKKLLIALRQLPDDVTEIVRLAWVYELPYGEIAKLTGIPIRTVKSRVYRARRLLHEQLRSNDDWV